MKRNMMIGIILLALLAFGGLALARDPQTIPPGSWVENLDDGSGYFADVLMAANVDNCVDSDEGMKPLEMGSIDVTMPGANRARHLGEYNTPTGKIREFACGSDILIDGQPGDPGKAYAFDYTPSPPIQKGNQTAFNIQTI
ncbi:MAG: hypothetical protein Q8P05_01360 [Candidatus Diapherotrites archaeon]|nr:hypothetical protein [Candidatus Diapherotrites archaeon]